MYSKTHSRRSSWNQLKENLNREYASCAGIEKTQMLKILNNLIIVINYVISNIIKLFYFIIIINILHIIIKQRKYTDNLVNFLIHSSSIKFGNGEMCNRPHSIFCDNAVK